MKRLNKKGFTLVELLAVIVVLAILMTVAGQAIIKNINQSKGNTFYQSVVSIRDAARTVCVNNGSVSVETLKAELENSDGLDITAAPNGFTVKSTKEGKYAGATNVKAKANATIYTCVKNTTDGTWSCTFTNPCSTGE